MHKDSACGSCGSARQVSTKNVEVDLSPRLYKCLGFAAGGEGGALLNGNPLHPTFTQRLKMSPIVPFEEPPGIKSQGQCQLHLASKAFPIQHQL